MTTSWAQRVEAAILAAGLAVARRWLIVAEALLVVFVSLPLLAPLLMARGATGPAQMIYSVYRITCHQEPQRSYFLAGPRLTYSRNELESLTSVRPLSAYLGSAQTGYKMAYCERDTATYLSLLLGGSVVGLLGARLPRLSLRNYAILLAPLALDGLTQATGLRESTWLLRTITGGLFGAATAWLLFPELDSMMSRSARELAARLERLR